MVGSHHLLAAQSKALINEIETEAKHACWQRFVPLRSMCSAAVPAYIYFGVCLLVGKLTGDCKISYSEWRHLFWLFLLAFTTHYNKASP